jgi:hypothetical protein
LGAQYGKRRDEQDEHDQRRESHADSTIRGRIDGWS